MKKALALAVVFVFCAAIGLAHGKDGGTLVTISKLDMVGKSMVVKTAEGKDMTIYWNDATKIEGTLQEGQSVYVKSSEKDGKIWATSVHVKVKKAS